MPAIRYRYRPTLRRRCVEGGHRQRVTNIRIRVVTQHTRRPHNQLCVLRRRTDIIIRHRRMIRWWRWWRSA